LLENAANRLLACAAFDFGGSPMNIEALETLPVVRCPGCEEPMERRGAAPVTRELDDISYVCPSCGAETKRTMKRA
jgi:DNA-directed RNA polymerase subunit RPC12/RpoP